MLEKETTNGSADTREQTATLGGGCFWCLEAVYQDMRGVLSVVSGYAGGHTDQPTYRDVCAGITGHAEVVQLVFDPSQCSYRQILEVFFTIHDPTTLNRQGNDVGTHYRSIIFYHNPEQQGQATAARVWASELWADPIVTLIHPFSRFFPAEAYHQNYFRKHPEQGYCAAIIAPKVATFRRKWSGLLQRS
jgi:peptide-methionine (S)-S-oxide reductase